MSLNRSGNGLPGLKGGFTGFGLSGLAGGSGIGFATGLVGNAGTVGLGMGEDGFAGGSGGGGGCGGPCSNANSASAIPDSAAAMALSQARRASSGNSAVSMRSTVTRSVSRCSVSFQACCRLGERASLAVSWLGQLPRTVRARAAPRYSPIRTLSGEGPAPLTTASKRTSPSAKSRPISTRWRLSSCSQSRLAHPSTSFSSSCRRDSPNRYAVRLPSPGADVSLVGRKYNEEGVAGVGAVAKNFCPRG
jgi:hypothetical protein